MAGRGRKGEDFVTLTQEERIYQIPDTEVGSVEPILRDETVYCRKTDKFVKVKTDLPEAVKRITLEIISNAGDNVGFSRRAKVDPGTIVLDTRKPGYLKVRSGGLPIPVEPDATSTAETLKLTPTRIYSQLNTSTNYDVTKTRKGCGRNGLGAKLTNLFSTSFVVKIGDVGRRNEKGKAIPGREYVGVWGPKLGLISETVEPPYVYDEKKGWYTPKGSRYYDGPPYVEVEWKLDFERMSMKPDRYTDDQIGLFYRYMIDYSMTCGIVVEIDGKAYDYRKIRDYARLMYPSEVVESAVSYFYSVPSNASHKFTGIRNEKGRENFIVENGYQPEFQVLFLDTPNEGRSWSFVNGLITADGGAHDEKLMRETYDVVKNYYPSKDFKIERKDVKPHVSYIFVAWVDDPKYSSQSKTKLESPTPPLKVSVDVVKRLLTDPNWHLKEMLERSLHIKDHKLLSKADGKKKVHLDLKKNLIDANEAGRAKSSQCTLYLVEGLSAMNYPRDRIDLEPGGRDLNGAYPFQGKLMNVMTHSTKEIVAYEEFCMINEVLGLRHGVDYTNEVNFKSLRYGRVIILTDADSDGSHITGLILNLFNHFWPSLFERDFIYQLVTPVIRIVKKGTKKIHRFYDELSFKRWSDEHNLKDYNKPDYFKGLGRSETEEVEDDYTHAPLLKVIRDRSGVEYIDLAFNPKRADDRKAWIPEWRSIRDDVIAIVEGTRETTVSRIMGHQFPTYIIDNLFRSIPCVYDGMKKAQRQILHYALHLYRHGNATGDTKKKLTNFSAAALEYSQYHHGESSLQDTAVKMTQDYDTRNNLPYFKHYGKYGSRENLGKDVSQARYLSIDRIWWTRYLYDELRTASVEKNVVEGVEAEPLWIPCDLPIGIINGNNGVSTGYSSFIPMHHPIEVAEWIMNRLDRRRKIEPLVPYYHGFTGDIEIFTRSKRKADESDDDSECEAEETVSYKGSGRGVLFRGKFHIESTNNDGTLNVVVTEVPVGISFTAYEKFLKKMLKDGLISDVRPKHKKDKPKFYIYGIKPNLVNHSSLRLEKTVSLTNLTMIDLDGIPKQYGCVENIVAEYVTHMLDVYTRYKETLIANIEGDIYYQEMKERIIDAFIDKSLKIIGRSKAQVTANLKELELDADVYAKISLSQLSKTDKNLLREKIERLKSERDDIIATTIEDMWKDRLEKFIEAYLKNGGTRRKLEYVKATRIKIDDESAFSRFE